MSEPTLHQENLTSVAIDGARKDLGSESFREPLQEEGATR
jgi:hypothetical protein